MFQLEKHLYNNEYFDVVREDPRRVIAYQQDAEKLIGRVSGNCEFLDVGAGRGEFGNYVLNVFQDGTYTAYDPFVYHNPFPEKMKFDAVIFRGVLQHIYNPVEMLMKAKESLNKGGTLAILATPDTDSLGYFRWGTLPALDPYRNWIPFGHRMLANILQRLEFKNIEFAWPYGYPYANKSRNLWNFIIGKPDAFPGNMMECFANV